MIKCLLFNVVEFPYLSRSLGVYRIAHVLREQGLDVEVVDWSNFWSLDQLQELVKNRNASEIKLIGFSHLFSIWSPVLEEFCQWIKQQYSHINIISGSAVNPRFKSAHVDYYIQGFGEHAIVELTKYLAGNGTRPKFSLNKINGAHIIHANDTYPAFPMESLMVRYQDRDFIKPDEWLTIEFARGCKFSCDFCNFPVLGVKGDYSRSQRDFELQMRDTYDRFGTKHYLVADETFNDSTEKVIKFADVVEKLNFDPWFSAYIRADLLVNRPAELEHLQRMNCVGHYYGVESFNTQSARSMGKGMNSEKLKQGLIEIRRYFENTGNKRYRGSIGLIAGLPHETVDTLYQTKQWLIDHWQGQAFTIYPLGIPVNEWIKPSKLTMNYQKYGYTEIDMPVIDKKIVGRLSNNAHIQQIKDGCLLWKNEHMNYEIADSITEEFVSMKWKFDFRQSNFTLANHTQHPLDIDTRLALNYQNFSNRLKLNVDDYIEKKLNL